MGTIPASIGQQWPEIAGQFPANGSFDNDTALIWADGGARAAAFYAKQTRDAVVAMAARLPGPTPMTPDALAAAIVAKLPTTTALDPATVAALGSAVATTLEQHGLGDTTPAQLAAALDAASASLKGGA